jgi:hypothetical protein
LVQVRRQFVQHRLQATAGKDWHGWELAAQMCSLTVSSLGRTAISKSPSQKPQSGLLCRPSRPTLRSRAQQSAVAETDSREAPCSPPYPPPA